MDNQLPIKGYSFLGILSLATGLLKTLRIQWSKVDGSRDQVKRLIILRQLTIPIFLFSNNEVSFRNWNECMKVPSFIIV